jgi:predicted metal-dependent hydrolase
VRARDAAGRPLPHGSPDGVEQVPDVERTADQALTLAQQLLDAGRAFYAHDVLEAAWKVAPPDERALWQGLAQVCVGLTHEQRGNAVGAARLLRRGAGRLREAPPAHGVPTAGLAGRAEQLAAEVEAGRPGDRSLRLR